MSRIVVALGGNALGETPSEQLELVGNAAHAIVDLVELGHEVIVSHGNGPQVGMINNGLSAAYEQGVISSDVPMPECVAMSQGYIGYHLQNSIYNELSRRGIAKCAITLITQILVREDDPSFEKPTKPIGKFYSKEQALNLEKEKGFIMVEDAGRGYRRVVPSPFPEDVIEKDIIKDMVERGVIVIVSGGGGIPVVQKNDVLKGIPAVIDKDLASEKVAEMVGAEILLILTAVDMVCINFNKENETALKTMTVLEAEQYSFEGQFASGSMKPKVQAAVSFAKKGGIAIITSLKNAKNAVLFRENCTVIS